ncbi:MAG: hypothetical protein AUJ72_00865 [Candidatus Omnitrophica bacterium CG1_02_46_14]|nr:MAG: hypothetical protein AUJ72_00865 [Candidatus Omnitrophica bacterium CG1_02_46_14]
MSELINQVYEKNPDFVYRQIAGESLLIPIRKKLNQVNNLYVLNETAAAIWNRIDGRRSMEGVLGDITQEFEVSSEQLRQDTAVLIQDLLSIEAVKTTVS